MIAAAVEVSFIGATTDGLDGHLIKIIAGLPVGLMRCTATGRPGDLTGGQFAGDDMDTVTSQVTDVSGRCEREPGSHHGGQEAHLTCPTLRYA
jgi:hypothetical protein